MVASLSRHFASDRLPLPSAHRADESIRLRGCDRPARLDELATRTTVDLKDRQMVKAFVKRIEINPEAKTGVVYLMADLKGALLRSSTLLPRGDARSTFGSGRDYFFAP